MRFYQMMASPPRSILVSAGEASGDLYAALLVSELRRRWPETHFFGCTGPRLRSAGVETTVRSEDLAVIGLIEVIAHLPRIYGEYRRLLRAVRLARPELAILTDSPDFHLRVAKRLLAWRIPVVYLVAPQVWAWRKHRVKLIRRVVARLLCIFPFEERFFADHGVSARYIGHPLASIVHPALSKAEFFAKHAIDPDRLLITMLPGSRRGEAARHLPELLRAAKIIGNEFPATFLLPASPNTGAAFFRERMGNAPVQVIEGEAWDAIAHAGVALAASGTVTVEAALLGTPMVTFYRVNPVSWMLGKLLVRVPFYSMVNLIAERRIVPELMQDQMTAERLSAETATLLRDANLQERMRRDLGEVAARLGRADSGNSSKGSAIQRAADEVEKVLEAKVV